MDVLARTVRAARVNTRNRGHRGKLAVLAASLAAACAFVFLYTAQPAVAAPTNFYVSTTGSDTTGNGSLASPWATIGKARDYIRTNGLNTSMTDDIIVNVAAGNYYVSSTISFTGADSGSNGHSIIYKNKDAVGSAHFIGGAQVTGWSVYSGNIYRANVGTSWKFYTLYENGVRARMARYPNYVANPDLPSQQGPYLTAEGVDTSHTVLQYKSGDLNPAAWSSTAAAQLFVWSGSKWNWFTDTIPISSINTTTRQITPTQTSRYWYYDHDYTPGSRYYIQGVLDLLDQPGEFFLDSSAGYLYYWPRTTPIGSQTIVAPLVKQLISVAGSSESSLAHDIQFDGLDFEDTDFTDWYRHAWVNPNDSGENHTYDGYDRQITLPQNRTGMVFLQNTNNVAIKNCHMKNAGYSAIYMLFKNGSDTISGNWIEHVGHSGVIIEGKYPGEGDVATGNVVTNNEIANVGELVGNAAGVYLMNASSNEVSYSDIFNSPRYAVALLGYTCAHDCAETPPAYIPSSAMYVKNNVIKYLRIHDVVQDSTDAGAVNAFGLGNGTPYNGNTFQQLTIDDSHADPSTTDRRPDGIFMDQLTFGQTFTNVRVGDSDGPAYRENLTGSETFSNVSWQSGFNDAAIDYANIGVKSTFPYPVVPAGVKATVGTSGVTISWKAINNATSASFFTVKRSTTAGGPYTTITCSSATSTSCLDTTYTPSVVNYYVVTSTVNSQESAPSREVMSDYTTSFENGLSGWSQVRGTELCCATSTAQAHTGSRSYVQEQNGDPGQVGDVIVHNLPSAQQRTVTLWYYDNASNTSLEAIARADAGTWDDSSWRAIGVDTTISTTNYVTRVDGTYTTTSVARSTGWHEFRWDYSSGSRVDMFIDGTLVGSPTGVTSVAEISLGDWWPDGLAGPVYWDDVTILPVFASDGFENGLGKWVTGKGTPSTSTAQHHSGSASFVVNQDADVIWTSLSANVHKNITLWFYDNASNTTEETMARADNTSWNDGSSWRGLGVDTHVSTTKYVTRIDGTYSATSVTRTTGWHELRWDYSSGTSLTMYIDGVSVATPTGVTSANMIAMGDWWTPSWTSTTYFDDVNVG